eukprot:6477248-Amphidinium_carterae.1
MTFQTFSTEIAIERQQCRTNQTAAETTFRKTPFESNEWFDGHLFEHLYRPQYRCAFTPGHQSVPVPSATTRQLQSLRFLYSFDFLVAFITLCKGSIVFQTMRYIARALDEMQNWKTFS